MDPLVMLFCLFQAEDGIRALYVTGVQTCALPISGRRRTPWSRIRPPRRSARGLSRRPEIGRASCRERGYIAGVVVSFKKSKNMVDGGGWIGYGWQGVFYVVMRVGVDV